MWSHYGGGHSGICYEFDQQALSKSLQESLELAETYFTEGFVKYSKCLPILPKKELYEYDANEFVFHKSDLWNYEEEYRFVCTSTKSTRKLKFSNDSLKALYIGASFPFGHPEYQAIWDAIEKLGDKVQVIVYKISQEDYSVETRFVFNANMICKIINDNKTDLGIYYFLRF